MLVDGVVLAEEGVEPAADGDHHHRRQHAASTAGSTRAAGTAATRRRPSARRAAAGRRCGTRRRRACSGRPPPTATAPTARRGPADAVRRRALVDKPHRGGGCDAAALRFSSAVRSSRPVSFGVRSSNVSTSVSPFVSTSILSWDGSRRGQVDSEEDGEGGGWAAELKHALHTSPSHHRPSPAVHPAQPFLSQLPTAARCRYSEAARLAHVRGPALQRVRSTCREDDEEVSSAAGCRTWRSASSYALIFSRAAGRAAVGSAEDARSVHPPQRRSDRRRRASPRRNRVQRRGGARRLRVLDLPRRVRALHAAEAVRAHAAEGVRHWHHTACLKQWYGTQLSAGRCRSCPLCKTPVEPPAAAATAPVTATPAAAR